METSHHLHPTMETVKMESMLPTESQSSNLLNSGQGGVKKGSVIESTSSKHGVAIDKQVRMTKTALSGKKDSLKDWSTKEVINTQEKEKDNGKEEKHAQSCRGHDSCNNISKIPLAELIEMAQKRQ